MDEREKKIAEKVMGEERETVMLTGLVRERVYEFLVMKKGYLPEEIEIDMPLEVSDGKRSEECTVDYIVRPGGRPLMAIKCALTALESSERHILAFCRVAGGIPISVVTNSEAARVIDTKSGKLVSEDIQSLPGRAEGLEMTEKLGANYSEDRIAKEKRILLAFNALRCSAPNACPGKEE